MCTNLFLFPSSRGSIKKVKTNTSEKTRNLGRKEECPNIAKNKTKSWGLARLVSELSPLNPGLTRNARIFGFGDSGVKASKDDERPSELIPEEAFFLLWTKKIVCLQQKLGPSPGGDNSAEPLYWVPVAVVLNVGFASFPHLAECQQ